MVFFLFSLTTKLLEDLYFLLEIIGKLILFFPLLFSFSSSSESDEEYSKAHHIREGVGLAAPQVGINKKIIALFYPINEKEYMTRLLANPKIVSNSIK